MEDPYMEFNTNTEFVNKIKSECKDKDFVEAISGFFIDSASDPVKQRVLTSFGKRVTLANGKPNIDHVELLDMYEEALSR